MAFLGLRVFDVDNLLLRAQWSDLRLMEVLEWYQNGLVWLGKTDYGKADKYQTFIAHRNLRRGL